MRRASLLMIVLAGLGLAGLGFLWNRPVGQVSESAEPLRIMAARITTNPPAPVPTDAAAAPSPAAATAAPTTAPSPAPAAPEPRAVSKPACDVPGAMGVARVVEIDSTGAPGFGFEHFKTHDFLRDKEVVLTFDDGPWPTNTPAVLKALADACAKAIFFPIGKHATYHPEILRQVAAQGHTIGSHTWGHINLRAKNETVIKDEIEKGFSAVRWALGADPAPFFRFPQLQHPPAAMAYLGERNVAVFSTDLDSFDFRTRKAETVVDTVMSKLEKAGKGIILMHDFQPSTAQALPILLGRLKDGGYRIVHIKPKGSYKTLPHYDEALMASLKQSASGSGSGIGQPTSSVVRTIAE